MHVKRAIIKGFRRFSELEILDIPASASLVIVAGPNGNGKSSLFDAFLNFSRRQGGFGNEWDVAYHQKQGAAQGAKQDRPQIEFHEGAPADQKAWRKAFYFRSAYRNDPDFTAGSISRVGSSLEEQRFSRLIDNDAAVSRNYQRLVGQGLEDVFEREDASTTIGQFRIRTIGDIQKAVASVLPELRLDSLGNPMDVGTFRFTKGVSSGYNYKNLSGGEKAVFDLILDLAVKRREFDNTVFCIDEPEAHLNPRVHAKMLDALLELTKEAGQLWVATHSIGMMRRAMELYSANPSTVAFLDFEQDFDQPTTLRPTQPTRAFWEKSLEIALDDLAALVAPSQIIACEGQSGDEIGDRVADAAIYNTIFGYRRPEARFVSIGAASNVEGDRFLVLEATAKTIKGCAVRRLIDRDEMTDAEREAKVNAGVKVLRERHLEAYLFDDEVVALLAHQQGKSQLLPDLLLAKQAALAKQATDGKGANNFKAAAGQMKVEFVKILGMTNAGKTKAAFIKDILVPLIQPETAVYAKLEQDIFL